MHGRSRLVVIASAGLLVAVSALAQDTSAPAKNADNTERNVIDRSMQTLTPLDQGNSKADLATTAQIRKDIMAAKNVSVNAQNVKIITNAGKVTLRGPVNTVEEKRLIGQIADKYAQPKNVDNQLEVKAITSNSRLVDQPTAPTKP